MKKNRYPERILNRGSLKLLNKTQLEWNFCTIFPSFATIQAFPPKTDPDGKNKGTISIRTFSVSHVNEKWMSSSLQGADVLRKLLSICRKNMQEIYNASRFQKIGWNDDIKKKEFQQEFSHFLIVNFPQQLPQAMNADGVIAFIFFRFELDEDNSEHLPICYIWELQIMPEFQSLGIGKHLIAFVEGISRYFGICKMMCTVQKKNTGASKFYKEKCGFVLDESNPDNFIKRGKQKESACDYEILKVQLRSSDEFFNSIEHYSPYVL
ncbi:acetyltransferase, GnaT family protein [Cardiosporidium cionae]|uniref:N-alpha-acetyltransferase 40 n=1 Tax=Cardiosporidium cionae TaxID=476202 RepID=A0ABQ7JFC2_9APIC|nr:acetyltransferase, GnaT family protein [Cardiosporidium cionae]|eukprot:KAF8822721.1 acetyltransferase, GnaT family protein [Cardiosporidium cionae]